MREPDGELIAMISGSNTNYYHYDALGSTRLLTNASGIITDRYTYDAYGSLMAHDRYTGSVDQPYQFVGESGYYTHYQEPEFGLLQLGVRFYDVETSRFTQVDPIREGWDWYVYVGNHPTFVIDPNGLQWDPGALCICNRVGNALSCVENWRNWWVKNHPWSKTHPPKYGKNMDKVALSTPE